MTTHLEVADRQAGRVALPVHRAGVLLAEARLLDQQRDVLLRHRLAYAAAHHPLQHLGMRQAWRRPVGHGVVPQRIDQAVAHLLLQRLRNGFQEAPGAMDMRRDLVEDREVAGELYQHHQHRGDVGIGQRCPERPLIAQLLPGFAPGIPWSFRPPSDLDGSCGRSVAEHALTWRVLWTITSLASRTRCGCPQMSRRCAMRAATGQVQRWRNQGTGGATGRQRHGKSRGGLCPPERIGETCPPSSRAREASSTATGIRRAKRLSIGSATRCGGRGGN